MDGNSLVQSQKLSCFQLVRAYAIANCASFQFYSKKKSESDFFSKLSNQLLFFHFFPPSVNFRQINCDDQRVHRRHHGLHHCARQRIVLKSTFTIHRAGKMAGFLGEFSWDRTIKHGMAKWRNLQTKSRFYMVLLGTRLDSITHRIHGAGIYANIYHQYTLFMLASIPAPWIRHGLRTKLVKLVMFVPRLMTRDGPLIFRANFQDEVHVLGEAAKLVVYHGIHWYTYPPEKWWSWSDWIIIL